MKKIAMVEYQGRCDENQIAVGHAPKVLTEYYELIQKEYETEVFAPAVILKNLPETVNASARELPFHIVMKGQNSFFEKINNKLNMFRNIKQVIKTSDADILWFFNVEYYLMLYLFLHRKPRQKVVCTLFLDGYHGGVVAKGKQWVFEKAQKKISHIISAGRNFKFANCKSTFIPDYVCKESVYADYRTPEKKNEVVCLGTMGKGKQLEELITAFGKMKYPLLVAGRFYDKAQPGKLRKMAEESGNGAIEIRDCYLSNEEYLRILGEAKYVILPYSPSQYKTQTSGVLQEALFLDTIPIAFRDVLEGNGVSGIALDTWEMLKDGLLLEDGEDIVNNNRQCRADYEEKRIAETYRKVMDSVLVG